MRKDPAMSHLIAVLALAVNAVARRAGLGSATALRQHLHAAIGVAPSTYRRTFRQR
jgi:transcriptional regulator GlxA family with amidase domain